MNTQHNEQTTKAKSIHGNFFQSVGETTYGSLITRMDAMRSPRVHFCSCGGIAKNNQLASGKYQVSCTVCNDKTIGHEKSAIATYLWNMSSKSQFPSRLSILPVGLTQEAQTKPDVLLAELERALEWTTKNTRDNEKIFALRYSVAWATWLVSNYSFLTDEEYKAKTEQFDKVFVNLARKSLPITHKAKLVLFRRGKKHLSEAYSTKKYLMTHCKSLFDSIMRSVDYPSRLRNG